MYITDTIHDAVGTTREKTPEGFLKVQAKIARSGIQEYMLGELVKDSSALPIPFRDKPLDSQVLVLRSESEVFGDASMDTFKHKPVTDNHPNQFVDSKNFRTTQVGFSGEKITRRNQWLHAPLILQDEKTVKNVEKNRKLEVSCGYSAEFDWQGGVDPQYGNYDAKITDIKCNHIAIVHRARAGSEARIADNKGKEPAMSENIARALLDGDQVMISKDTSYILDAHLKEVKELQNKTQVLKDSNTKLSDELAATKEKYEKLQGEFDAYKLEFSDEKIEGLVIKRQALLNDAKVLHPNIEVTGKSVLDIRKEAIAFADKSMDLTDKGDAYVEAVFDTMVSFSKKEKAPRLNDALATNAETNQVVDEAMEARKRFDAAYKDAWKGAV